MLRAYLLFLGVVFCASAVFADDSSVQPLFEKHCASCHGADRLGRMGPALLPENLHRLKKKQALQVVGQGRAATQMPAFRAQLSAAEIEQLVEYIYTPLKEIPRWGLKEITDSQIVHHARGTLPDKPLFSADPMNLFVVVELGDHHATILDGDRMEPLHRFQTRPFLHGGPKYSPDGRYVYFGSRDGWVSKFDIYNFKIVAEVRAGINMRNIAVSGDGRYLMAANYLPHTLVVLDTANLKPIKVIPVQDADGKGVSSRVSAVYTAEPRETFIAALKDLPEVWEISYADDPPPGFSGWEHDYNLESGDAVKPDPFPVRRIRIDTQLDDFFFDQDYVHLIGTSRDGIGRVINLDIRRVLHKLDVPGMPHLASGITWKYQGRPVMATPNLKDSEVSIVDMETWKTIKRIKTLGPGFFMRSHENSPYAWVDVFFGADRDAVHVIDKQSLEIVKTLRPAPGKTAAHVEFDRYGKYALLSIWDMDGAVIVYDASTLEELKRLPMKKPSGKYNVYNKISRSAGTSH